MTEKIQEQVERMKRGYTFYAQAAGYRLNPDEARVELVLKGLIDREAQYGHRYCPCRVVTQDPVINKGLVCPCVYYKDEIAEHGHCACKLFFRKERVDATVHAVPANAGAGAHI